MKLPKIPLPFVIIFLLAWQVLLTFQGLDLADTGFHLSAFRFAFIDPYSVQYYMMYWLSEVGGHCWMALLPGGGLLWARFGWVFFISLSVFVFYLLLKEILGKERAVCGLGITLIFALFNDFVHSSKKPFVSGKYSDPKVGSPPPIIWRSPKSVSFLIVPAQASSVLKR